MPGLVSPAARLHATDRQDELHARRHQDRDVDDPVLLGPDENLAFGDQSGRLHLFLTARLGTLPDSLTSSTTAWPASIAVLSSV